MNEQELISVTLGAIVSFILQLLKRWYTFTPIQIKGLIILIAIVYGIATGLIDTRTNMITNGLSFIVGNQTFFALIFNNTSYGYKIAGIKEDF